MSNLSDFGERKFIDFALRAQTAPATTYYLGVSTTAFAEDVTASNAAAQEPSDSAYVRKLVQFNTASSRTISNLYDIEFEEATESQGSIGYWAIFDGSDSTANTVAQGSFTTARTVATGDVLRVATGDLDISVSSIWGLHWGNALLNGFFGDDTRIVGTSATGAFSTTSNSSNWWLTSASDNDYRQYTQYYLGVSTSAFDLSVEADEYMGGSSGTWNSTRNLTSDEKVNISKEPWAPASPTPTFNNLAATYQSNGYGRTAIDFSAASTSTGTTTMVSSAAVSFPEATASWGSIGYWAIFASNSRSSLGSSVTAAQRENTFNLLFPIIGGSFTTAKTVGSGDVLRINAGDFILTPQ
jgi:hypothetical protein